MSTPTLILPKTNPIDGWHHFYRAKVISVYDGDTVTMVVEQGFYSSIQIDLRLRDIDTSEIKRGPTLGRIKGADQRDYVARVLRRAQPPGVQWPVAIVTHKNHEFDPGAHKWDRTFTRWVGDIVIDGSGTTITDKVLARWPEVYAPQ